MANDSLDAESQSATASMLEDSRVIPQEVQDFLVEMHSCITNHNVEAMKRLYELDFNHISEAHYSKIRWPSEDRVDQFYRQNDIFNSVVSALYRELFFRHLLAKCPDQSTWADRFYSSLNYNRLLEYVINNECKPDRPASPYLPLSLHWQWDMVDEFVYQYQETQRWKAQYAKDIVVNPTALEALRAGSQAWRCSDVLSLLTRLIQSSGVQQYLENQHHRHHQSSNIHSSVITRAVSDPDLPITMGYFAIISLMRLHVAMGDYRSALDVASLIEFSPTALYWKVPAAHITLFYNLGFAYMMMRRYQDAIRVLSQILTFLGRSRSYLSIQGYQQDAMLRMSDRIYHLVMLCNALSPTRLDETIQAYIQVHLSDKHFKLQSDEEDSYREVFLKAAPKFFNPFVSDYSDPQETFNIDKNEPTNRQVNMFLKDVSYQKKVFNVRSIAKLYNNLTLTKLANLMGLKQENAIEIVRSEMLCVKNRAEQLIWKSGPLLSGERVQMLADLDIYLDIDTIHVKNLTTQRNYVDYFLKQIHRTQDLLNPNATPTKSEPRKLSQTPIITRSSLPVV